MIDDYNWLSEAYLAGREHVYRQASAYLGRSPKRILDIGAGYARVSELFQINHSSELWLLDGDFNTTSDRTRKGKYGSVEDFKYYRTQQDLEQHWTSQGMRYTFVNGNDPQIDPDVKFDLVTSWLSCGYHYPISVYADLIRKHTDENSVVIMDFRRKTIAEQQKDFTVVSRLDGDHISKYYTLHIKLN